MPRAKSNDTDPPQKRPGELLGLALLGIAVVLLVALLSYDRNDISWVKQPPNHPPHNMLGLMGAWVAYVLTLGFGGRPRRRACMLSMASQWPFPPWSLLCRRAGRPHL